MISCQQVGKQSHTLAGRISPARDAQLPRVAKAQVVAREQSPFGLVVQHHMALGVPWGGYHGDVITPVRKLPGAGSLQLYLTLAAAGMFVSAGMLQACLGSLQLAECEAMLHQREQGPAGSMLVGLCGELQTGRCRYGYCLGSGSLQDLPIQCEDVAHASPETKTQQPPHRARSMQGRRAQAESSRHLLTMDARRELAWVRVGSP